MKKILIIPDSFKESISAHKFCDIAKEAALPFNVATPLLPMSDGGEGFLDALFLAYPHQLQSILCDSVDPRGKYVSSVLAWDARKKVVFIELANTSGLHLVAKNHRVPSRLSTFGTGLHIKMALKMGAKKIVIGLGGSATNDGGMGALRALGFQFLDVLGNPVSNNGAGLLKIASIRPAWFDGCEVLLLAGQGVLFNNRPVEFVLACDVTNPLVGDNGATAIFGPQKGVTPDMAITLEKGLNQFANCIKLTTGVDVSNVSGAGAAGGFAGGFTGLLNAKIMSGFDLLENDYGIEAQLARGDVIGVITGEGHIDSQTGQGKMPARVASLAKRYGVPCIGVCGKLSVSVNALPMFDELICIHENMPSTATQAELFLATPENLKTTLARVYSRFLDEK